MAWRRKGIHAAAVAKAAYEKNPNKFDELYVLRLIRQDAEFVDNRFEVKEMAAKLFSEIRGEKVGIIYKTYNGFDKFFKNFN